MPGLTDALRAASERAVLEHQKTVRERRIQHAADVYGHASTYDNAIVLAGYAAFFGLWAGVADDVGPLSRLITASLMGLSLLCYIAWHLIQMLTRQRFEAERADTFTYEDDAPRFNAAWEDIAARYDRAHLRHMRFWLPLFVPSVFLGFVAGLVLVYDCAAGATGLPRVG